MSVSLSIPGRRIEKEGGNVTPYERYLSIKVTDALFCLGFVIYMIQNVIMSAMNIGGSYTITTLALIAIFALKTLMTIIENRTINVSSLSVIAILVWMLISIQMNSGTNRITILMILLASSYRVNPRIIAKTALVSILASVGLILCLAISGAIPNTAFIQGSRIRHAVGFTYVGMLDLYVLHVALLAIYLKDRHISLPFIVLFLVSHGIAYSYSLVRGTLTVAILVWLLYLGLFQRTGAFNCETTIAVLAVLSTPLCCLISFYTAVHFQPGSPSWELINDLLSGRLVFAQRALTTYGITPFGRVVEWVGAAAVQSGRFASYEYNYVDSGYLQIAIQYGLVTLICVVAAYTTVSIYAFRYRMPSILLWVIAIAIESLIYPNLLTVSYNSLPVIAFAHLSSLMSQSEAS